MTPDPPLSGPVESRLEEFRCLATTAHEAHDWQIDPARWRRCLGVESREQPRGLTHTCDDGECHVPGFVATLNRKWPHLPCPVCKGDKAHAAACPVPALGFSSPAPADEHEGEK